MPAPPQFISGDGELVNSNLGTSFSRAFTAGEDPMDFMYQVLNTGMEVSNGNNYDQFMQGMLPTYAFGKYGDTYYLGLNDDGSPLGNEFDFDVNDFVVSFTVEEITVPEPASGALLGLGLLGVALARLNRKQR